MATRRLFVDRRLSAGSTERLEGDEAHYVGRVLRCRAGDGLALFNGDGSEYAAHIERVDKAAVHVVIDGRVTPAVESPLELRLIQCISKGERMDTVVQKACELGVRRISPVSSRYSVVRLDRARAERRLAHWRRIARSACEQCGRVVPPQVDAPCTLADLLDDAPRQAAARLLLLPGADLPLAAAEGGAAVELLVGPEGGFSDAETAQALQAGFTGVSLGPRILRTETAAIAALALAQAWWGDLAGP